MIKLTFCLRRLPHLTREEFQAHWIGPHRDIMIEHKRTLGYRRYVQSHTIGGDWRRVSKGAGAAPSLTTARRRSGTIRWRHCASR